MLDFSRKMPRLWKKMWHQAYCCGLFWKAEECCVEARETLCLTREKGLPEQLDSGLNPASSFLSVHGASKSYRLVDASEGPSLSLAEDSSATSVYYSCQAELGLPGAGRP